MTIAGIEIRESCKIPEPKCPDCGVDVNRPKCLLELGTECPRHDVRVNWKRDMLKLEQAERASSAGDCPFD